MQEPQETWVPSLGQEDSLEEEMASHSNILAWEIPCTEELDRLQSMGSQTVGHSTHILYICNLQVALVVKNPPANAGGIREKVSIPGSGRSPGGGHGNPLQYFFFYPRFFFFNLFILIGA